jgi:hypothetical protein
MPNGGMPSPTGGDPMPQLHDPVPIDFSHPANARVLQFLGISEPASARSCAPAEVNLLALGTHPDLVEHLWKLAAGLPLPCACVVNERSYPLLAHPGRGIIFGLAGGTSTLALRLPEPELTRALAEPRFGREYRYPSGAVRAAEIGDEWALVRPFAEANGAWCARAFSYAEAIGPAGDHTS